MSSSSKTFTVPAQLVVFVISMLCIVPSVFLYGWVVKVAWAWFTPILWPGIPLLTWAQGAALRTLLFIVMPFPLPKPDTDEDDKGAGERIGELLGRTILLPLVYLFIAWVVYVVIR